MKFTMQNNLKFNNEEIFLRKQIRKIISEVYVDSSLGTAEDTYNPIRTSLLNFNELIYMLGKKFGFEHEMLKEILWEIRMERNPDKLQKEIIRILKNYGAYKDFHHLIYMNENDIVDELYPMLVGEDDLGDIK